MATQLPETIEATRSLCAQATDTLFLPAPPQSATNPSQPQHEPPDAQSLLTPSASLLRAQTTKLSLLASSAPFTPSAIASVLVPIKDSILPALLTATLLTHDATAAFHTETKLLARDVFASFAQLLAVVGGIAIAPPAQQQQQQQAPDAPLPEDRKNELMQATGKTWEACDAVVELAAGGVVGLVIRRARSHLELLKDGIRELEEWEPEEDDDDGFFFDDGRGEDNNNGGNDNSKKATAPSNDDNDDDDDDDEEEQNRLKLLTAEKEKLVRFLSIISKVYPAIISQCLKPLLPSSSSASSASATQPAAPQATNPAIEAGQMESMSSALSDLPGLVDDIVGSLYDGEVESVAEQKSAIVKRAQQAMDVAISSLSADDSRSQTRDKLVKWNDGWCKILEKA